MDSFEEVFILCVAAFQSLAGVKVGLSYKDSFLVHFWSHIWNEANEANFHMTSRKNIM